MAIFFPVVQAGPDAVSITSQATARPDTTESAWSIMQRLAIAATMIDNQTYTLTVNEATKVLTLAGTAAFALTIGTSAAYTGFSTAGAATSHTSSAISGARALDLGQGGLVVPTMPLSFGAGKPASDASSVAGGLYRRGSLTVSCQISYVNAFDIAKTLRSGTWDVVSEGLWLARLRVTSARIVPQGRGQGKVQMDIGGQVVA